MVPTEALLLFSCSNLEVGSLTYFKDMVRYDACKDMFGCIMYAFTDLYF